MNGKAFLFGVGAAAVVGYFALRISEWGRQLDAANAHADLIVETLPAGVMQDGPLQFFVYANNEDGLLEPVCTASPVLKDKASGTLTLAVGAMCVSEGLGQRDVVVRAMTGDPADTFPAEVSIVDDTGTGNAIAYLTIEDVGRLLDDVLLVNPEPH